MQNKKRYWLRGGLLFAIIFIGYVLFYWIRASVLSNCILEPIQTVAMNTDGTQCLYTDYFSFLSLTYFGIPALLGFIFGAVVGGLFGLIKKQISR